MGHHQRGNGRRCGILVPAVPLARCREGEYSSSGGYLEGNRIRTFLNPRWLTTELPGPVVGLGSPSRFEDHPSQDLLRVSLSRVNWESNLMRDANDCIPLPTELPEYAPSG